MIQRICVFALQKLGDMRLASFEVENFKVALHQFTMQIVSIWVLIPWIKSPFDLVSVDIPCFLQYLVEGKVTPTNGIVELLVFKAVFDALPEQLNTT